MIDRLYEPLGAKTLLSYVEEATDFHSELRHIQSPTFIFTGGNGAGDFNIYTLDYPNDVIELIYTVNFRLEAEGSSLRVHSPEQAMNILANTHGIQTLLINSPGLYILTDTLDLTAHRVNTLADLFQLGYTYFEYFSLIDDLTSDDLVQWRCDASSAGDTVMLEYLDEHFDYLKA